MTTASLASAARHKKRITVQNVVDFMKVRRACTVHEAAVELAQTSQFGDIQESGQFWAEVVSRFGEAAKKGFLDDSVTVQVVLDGRTTARTLYKYLDTPAKPRLSATEQLREENAVLKAKLAELQVKYEMACATIDRLSAKD